MTSPNTVRHSTLSFYTIAQNNALMTHPNIIILLHRVTSCDLVTLTQSIFLTCGDFVSQNVSTLRVK